MPFRYHLAAFITRLLARAVIGPDSRRVGRRIQRARKGRGLDIEALARCSGLRVEAIRRWGRGDPAGLDSYAVELLSKCLGRSPAWLLAGEEEREGLGAALCADRIVPLIVRFEELPLSTRRRLARYLLFIALIGQQPSKPARRRR